jgi:HEPN domain-containing protein
MPLCSAIDPEFEALKEILEVLDPYAIDVRYPGQPSTREEAREAFEAAKKVRRFVRGKLGLESQRRLL